MKRTLAIVCLLLCAVFSLAQEPLVSRSTKSCLIVDGNTKDAAFLKEKSRQAGIDIGLTVLANRIPTDSRLVAPKPSKHLLKQGLLQLQLPIDDSQTEFAVYHSDLFAIPATINVMQIDDELVTYRSTEAVGNIHVFYGCTRGAFGTRRAAHSKNAVVYKLWDTPERTLLPDLETQDRMVQAEAKRCATTDYSLLIFNDLKSYAYNEQGDLAIGHLLDTMLKYNPDKRLQADLLTPASWPYLSCVNENQLWNETMRSTMVETLTEKEDFYRKTQMAWMIGTFRIHTADKKKDATTLEELEWLLSKAAAFDAGFGLYFDASAMRKHGLTDAMLDAINIWESLRLADAFGEAQKEAFKDPYGNWHIEKSDDTTYLLYPQHISRGYRCNLSDDRWEWNSPYASRYALRIKVEGKGSISELEVRTPNGILYLPCTIQAGQYLIYGFDGSARLTDSNYNTIAEITPRGTSLLDEGPSEVSFHCEAKAEERKMPIVTVRYYTRGEAETLEMSPHK